MINTGHSVSLYGKKLQTEDPIVHLGIHRSSNYIPNIEEKINLGRRTAYSLMGAGFHGKSGLKPSIKADMWRKYVVPRLIYGLEVHNPRKKKDVLQLEAFQRRCLTQLQSLPNRTSDTASMALLGMLPANVYIEKNTLSLFGRIARDQSCIENDLAKRQLAVRDPSDKSWFSSVRNILNTYWLPTAYELMEHPPQESNGRNKLNVNYIVMLSNNGEKT